MAKMLIKTLLFFALYLHGKEAVKLSDILKESRDAMLDNSFEKSMAVLKERFFTDNKNESIWWVGQKAHYAMFNVELGFENMRAFEVVIQRLNSHLITCEKQPTKKLKSRCYYLFVQLLEDTSRDFEWDYDPDVSKWTRVKFGTFFNCFTAMASHIALLTRKVYLGPPTDVIKVNHHLTGFIEKLHAVLYDYETCSTTWRLDQITAVEICDVKTRFWKDFTGSCETRWKKKRSVIEGEDKQKRATDEDEDASGELDYDNEVNLEGDGDNDILLSKAALIGGYNHSIVRFEAKVTDIVKQKTIFEKSGTALIASKGDVVERLYKEGIVARGKHHKVIEKTMKRFHAGTIQHVRDTVKAFLNSS